MVKMSNNASNALMHLQMQHVTFGYKREPLLYDVSLSIGAGEMVGLLGPNGSGKTTLLRLLSGVVRPQQGNVLLAGRSLQRWGRRGVAQRIAVVAQELHIPFAFTVEHMVSLGRIPFVGSFAAYTARDKMIVQDAMHIASVTALAQRVFNELSGGERQRVLIAKALAQEPLVLLLDEPTAHLDIKYQIETLALLQRLNREREVTVVAAMHDLNLAARYFPRLILFQRGVVADAGPAQVLEPGLLGRVYDVNVQVGILRGAEHLSVLPPGNNGDEQKEPVHALVHVIAGGGSGELMMRALADAHIPFSAGALNIGDSDYTLALRLAQEVIVEQPYAPIAPEAVKQVQVCLERAVVLILCPAPIGPGNLVLLQQAVAAAQRGLPTLLLTPAAIDTTCVTNMIETDDGELERTGMATRDYTDGEALKLVGQLLQAGARVVSSVGEAVESVKRYILQQGAVER